MASPDVSNAPQSRAKPRKRPRPDPATLPTLAFIGTNYDGAGEVVWAKTRGQAKAAAAAALECDFNEVVSLKRYPELDHFTGNLRAWLLERGWSFECQKCSKVCYAREEGETDGTVLDERDHVFCCVAHQQEYEAYWGMHRAIDAAILEDFKKLHPDVEVPYPSVSVGHNEWYGWVDAGERIIVWEMVSVHRSHVSAVIAPAYWTKQL